MQNFELKSIIFLQNCKVLDKNPRDQAFFNNNNNYNNYNKKCTLLSMNPQINISERG